MSNFGANIKKIRSLKNYTQQHLAEILGLTRAAVSSYEEGRAEPKIETLTRASQIFEVSMDDLVNRKLTVNELANFKLPEIEWKAPVKEPIHSLFPADANWMSVDNAIIIDDNFREKQILLTQPDQPDSQRPQLIYTTQGLYLASEKTLTEDWVLLGTHKIARDTIKSVHRIIGTYLAVDEPLPATLTRELTLIKKRLDQLERKLRKS
ncbi:helix-turn-helix domain-containing protein [Niabella terrae]